jgi:TonB family protein
MDDVLAQSAIDAVSQWQYDPPANAPIAFNVTVSFAPESAPVVIAPNSNDAIGGSARSGAIPPPPPPPPPPSPWANAIRVGKGKPTLLKRVNPVYPQAAQDAKIQGVVILDARIDETGRVSDLRVLRSIPELDAAAMDAVRQWEYEPALLNGQAVPVLLTITVAFTLS